MSDWLSEIEEDTNFMLKLSPKDTTGWAQGNYKARAQMARVIRQLTAVAKTAASAYKRLVMIQKLGPLGRPPMWTQNIGDALDNLSPDAKELL